MRKLQPALSTTSTPRKRSASLRNHRRQIRQSLQWVLTSYWLLLGIGGVHAFAANHALLVGINSYPSIRQLQGAVPDVIALQAELETRWGVPRGNIVALTEQRATKAAILAGLDALIDKLQPGDTGLFYFSGHGVSRFDAKNPGLVSGLDPNSGAICPYDSKAGSPAEVMATLIVGNRDLRPRLARVRQGATLFVVFDSCNSGSAAKTLATLPTRAVPWGQLATRAGLSKEEQDAFAPAANAPASADPDDWPYSNVIFLAAASKFQAAIDVRRELLQKHPTIDGQPHGAMTDAILRAFRGGGDLNGDGAITYRELHATVRGTVEERHDHTPQLRYPASAALQDSPVLGNANPRLESTPSPKVDLLRVRLEDAPPGLSAKIGSIANLTLAPDAPDLVVRASQASLAICLPSYEVVMEFPPQQEADFLRTLAKHAQAHRLLALRYPRQDFELDFSLRTSRASQESVLTPADKIRFWSNAKQPYYPLMLNIDKHGEIVVLYASAVPVAAGEAVELPLSGLPEPPYGAEHVKLFGFRSPPPGYTSWIGRIGKVISADSDTFRELLRLVSNAQEGRAEVTRKLVTVENLERIRP